jgi:AcrR family transcriptional regulator
MSSLHIGSGDGKGLSGSLDDIAKQAGVGPGTLYRHFPSREDLLKAVYQTAAEKLATAATHMDIQNVDASPR